MVELSGSWLCQQHFPLESSAFRDRMIAPVEHRQHEFLPASINPCRVSANLGLNGLGYSGFSNRGLTIEDYGSIQNPVPHSLTTIEDYGSIQNPVPHSLTTPLTPNQFLGEQNPLFPDRVGEKPSTCELPSAQQKKFLIFDRSGNETRLIFSSLCPRVENLTAPPTTCPAWNMPAEESFGAYHQYLAEKQGLPEEAWTKTPALCEESGENEIIDEISEMREDTEEINALLYSEDDNDDNDDGLDDDDCDGEDDDEVSSGHSPLAKEIRYCEKQEELEGEKVFNNEVTSLERSSKRQKALHGGCNRRRQSPAYEDDNNRDFIGALNERMCPMIGSKRPRKDKIHDTLRVLENIIPGLKSKDPLVILDEAISYLKGLKCNAETMLSEEPDSSSSYEPLN